MAHMLGRVINWWRDSRQWRRDHILAFSQARKKSQDGLTLFQNKCLTAVATYVPQGSFERVTHPDGTLCLVAPLDTQGTRLFIYDVEAGIYGQSGDLRYEEWDFRSPEDLISTIVRAVAEIVSFNRAFERDAPHAARDSS